MILNYNDPRVVLKQVYKRANVGDSPLLGACIIGPNYKGFKKEQIQDNAKYPELKVLAFNFAVQQPGTSLDISAVLAANSWIMPEVTPKFKVFATFTSGDITDEAGKQANVSASDLKGYVENITDFKFDWQYNNDTTTITFNVTFDVPQTIKVGNYCISNHQGTIYIQPKFACKTYLDKHGIVVYEQNVQDLLGQICPQNPLGIAVAAAVANSGQNFVYFIATDPGKQTVKQYNRALDIMQSVQGCYSIVPCTNKPEILRAMLADIIKQSQEQIPTFMYLCGSADFAYKDEVPKDVATKTQYMVKEVITAKNKRTFSHRRGFIAIADHARFNGMLVDNYVVAAAIAGLRSKLQPQAPLSNVALAGIQTADDSGFTRSQSKLLGANGFWRVGMSQTLGCITRRQLTSAATGDVNHDEQSIVCVIDAICTRLKKAGSSYIGNSNISPALLTILDAQLRGIISRFTTTEDPFIGPMLLSCTLDQLVQDQFDKSRFKVKLTGQPPKPFNEFQITFYMI